MLQAQWLACGGQLGDPIRPATGSVLSCGTLAASVGGGTPNQTEWPASLDG